MNSPNPPKLTLPDDHVGVPIKEKIECTMHPEENDGKGIKLKSFTGSKRYYIRNVQQ